MLLPAGWTLLMTRLGYLGADRIDDVGAAPRSWRKSRRHRPGPFRQSTPLALSTSVLAVMFVMVGLMARPSWTTVPTLAARPGLVMLLMLIGHRAAVANRAGGGDDGAGARADDGVETGVGIEDDGIALRVAVLDAGNVALCIVERLGALT